MMIQTFEELISWQKARILAGKVYQLFRSNRDYGFRDQIQRAVISISNNIAEGFERKSNKELSQFLFIAKGSCGEVRSMSYVALDLAYISKADFDFINSSCLEISKLLSGFIKKL